MSLSSMPSSAGSGARRRPPSQYVLAVESMYRGVRFLKKARVPYLEAMEADLHRGASPGNDSGDGVSSYLGRLMEERDRADRRRETRESKIRRRDADRIQRNMEREDAFWDEEERRKENEAE